MHAQGLQDITNRWGLAPIILGRHDDNDHHHRGNFLTLIGSSGEGPRLPISHLLQKLHFRGGKLHFPPFVFVRSMCTFSCTFLCHLILMQTSMLIYSNNNRTHSSSRTSERVSSRSSSICSSHYTAMPAPWRILIPTACNFPVHGLSLSAVHFVLPEGGPLRFIQVSHKLLRP